jgi:glycerol-3-phosphate dehydrogenase (NAD(P)+)
MKHFAIIGAGSWGTALAVVAGRAGHHVRIWARSATTVQSINHERVNVRYLPEATIPDEIYATTNFDEALKKAEFVILAAPSHVTREILEAIGSRTAARNDSCKRN